MDAEDGCDRGEFGGVGKVKSGDSHLKDDCHLSGTNQRELHDEIRCLPQS